MTALKLRAVGRSTGAIFPKDVLEKLNVKEGDELHLSVVNNTIVLTPSDPAVTEQIEAMRKSMRDYREVYEALAK
jgi:putative addiction module antidote